MGIGQRPKRRSSAEEGASFNPHLLDYKPVTAGDALRIDVDWIETPAQNGGPRGSKESASR